ncbi:hypothetical protein N7468_002341 [Penicillium chermesinum]|uniref:BTB domain-containing protein n=1 Tax=Penicillium chermesinum TaxID=63820 RepID=A0A9W9TYC0_9EURO|nr:uncharacterized protein N7468_002341 [Penicillium chermesinum]KAJ5247358.1 hypothetical protein N7468_002341 [Penicillium chermesinum]
MIWLHLKMLKPPTRLKVGKEDKCYYVHPGVFASSALCPQILDSWKGAGDDTIDLTEYEEETVECALSYLYTRDYSLPQVTPELDKVSEAEAGVDDSQSTGSDLPEGEYTNENESHTAESDGVDARALTPIEDMFDLNSSAIPEVGDEDGQLLATEALAHAKIFSFAHKYLMSDLEDFALHRLAQTLCILQQLEIGLSPALAEAIQLVYHITPSDAQIPARKLLSQFVALELSTLLSEHLDMLVLQGGDFSLDVLHKLGRRIDDLESENSALEEKCSELEGKLEKNYRR